MKLLPFHGLNDFSGSAGNVTARKTGDKTVLSTNQTFQEENASQATTRCRFSDTIRAYSRITKIAPGMGLVGQGFRDLLLSLRVHGHKCSQSFCSWQIPIGKCAEDRC